MPHYEATFFFSCFLFLTFQNKSPSSPAVLFCCEAPDMFRGLWNFTWLTFLGGLILLTRWHPRISVWQTRAGALRWLLAVWLQRVFMPSLTLGERKCTGGDQSASRIKSSHFLPSSKFFFLFFFYFFFIEHVCVGTADWKMCDELGASVPAHWSLPAHHSPVCSCSALTPEVTEGEWSCELRCWPRTELLGLPLESVRRARLEIKSDGRHQQGGGMRACDGLWTFPFVPVGQGITSLHRELRFFCLRVFFCFCFCFVFKSPATGSF